MGSHPWYGLRAAADDLMQGDIFWNCVRPELTQITCTAQGPVRDSGVLQVEPRGAMVVTQTCDLAKRKDAKAPDSEFSLQHVTLAPLYSKEELLQIGAIKKGDWGLIENNRVFGLFYLPPFDMGSLPTSLPASAVDFRKIFTLQRSTLTDFCKHGFRTLGLETPYRENCMMWFAYSYMRIGVPVAMKSEAQPITVAE